MLDIIHKVKILKKVNNSLRRLTRAQELGAKRRRSGDPSGIYKSERAGYNLAQSQRSVDTDAATQRGNQTGGGPKDFGFARHKKNPVKSKSIGDTGAQGHRKKANEKITHGKKGQKLKTPRYKLSAKQRSDHHSDVWKREELRDPKKNPKHTANTQKEQYVLNLRARLKEELSK